MHRISGGRTRDGSWSRRAGQIRQESRRAAADELTVMLTELAEGRHSGGQSVEGLQETLTTLATGRVRLLLLAADAAQGTRRLVRTRTRGRGRPVTGDGDRCRFPILRGGVAPVSHSRVLPMARPAMPTCRAHA
jgi:hypothetical protein